MVPSSRHAEAACIPSLYIISCNEPVNTLQAQASPPRPPHLQLGLSGSLLPLRAGQAVLGFTHNDQNDLVSICLLSGTFMRTGPVPLNPLKQISTLTSPFTEWCPAVERRPVLPDAQTRSPDV